MISNASFYYLGTAVWEAYMIFVLSILTPTCIISTFSKQTTVFARGLTFEMSPLVDGFHQALYFECISAQ